MTLNERTLHALEDVARQATPGQWERLAGDYGRRIGSSAILAIAPRSPNAIVARVESADPQHHHDAAYLATFSPDTVLELIGAARRLAAVEAAIGAGRDELPADDEDSADGAAAGGLPTDGTPVSLDAIVEAVGDIAGVDHHTVEKVFAALCDIPAQHKMLATKMTEHTWHHRGIRRCWVEPADD